MYLSWLRLYAPYLRLLARLLEGAGSVRICRAVAGERVGSRTVANLRRREKGRSEERCKSLVGGENCGMVVRRFELAREYC